MKVYLCYTYDDNHERQLIKVIGDYQASRDWLHLRSDMIANANKMFARYLLAKKKDKSRVYHKYYEFRTAHGLWDSENPNSPFVHSWEVDE